MSCWLGDRWVIIGQVMGLLIVHSAAFGGFLKGILNAFPKHIVRNG